MKRPAETVVLRKRNEKDGKKRTRCKRKVQGVMSNRRLTQSSAYPAPLPIHRKENNGESKK